MKMLLARPCALLWAGLALAVSVGAQEEQQNPFPEVFDDDDYQTRAKPWTKRMNQAREMAKNPDHPAAGYRFLGWANNNPGGHPDMPKGSIFYERDGHRSWAGYFPPIVIDHPYTLEFVGPDGERGTRQMNPGPINAAAKPFYNPGVAYLQGKIGRRDPAWDEFVLVACLTQTIDRELCEAALHRAYRAGYEPDALLAWFETVLSTLTKRGPEEPMERFLAHFEDEPIAWAYVPPLHEVLATTGRIDFMRRIAEVSGDHCVYDSETVEQFSRWTGGETTWPAGSLLERAEKRRGPVINDRFNEEEISRREGREKPLGELTEFESAPGSYFTRTYSPKGDIPHGVHHRATIKAKALGFQPPWMTVFRVALIRNLPENEPRPETEPFESGGISFKWRLLQVRIARTMMTKVSTSGNSLPGIRTDRNVPVSVPFVDDPQLPSHLSKVFERMKDRWTGEAQAVTLDLIRLGSEMGIFVDGICFLHLPADPEATDNFEVMLHSVGMKATVDQYDIWALKE